jgi:hypothetical protein
VSAEDGLELDLHLVGVLERRFLRWLAIDLHLVGVLEGESCGCAISHRSSTRCPIAASGLRGLSVSISSLLSKLRNSSPCLPSLLNLDSSSSQQLSS